MQRHSSLTTRRFYTAFYRWTVLTANPHPHLRRQQPACLHPSNRNRASFHQSSRADNDDDDDAFLSETEPVQRRPLQLRKVGCKINDGREGYRGRRPAMSVTGSQNYRRGKGQDGGKQPRDSVENNLTPQRLPQPPPPAQHQIPPPSWLEGAVQVATAVPFDTLAPWQEVVRYRSQAGIMVETAVPVDVLSNIQRVYGMGLAEMRNKFGARVEVGGSSEKVGVQVRSVVASGTYEEVTSVRGALLWYRDRVEGKAVGNWKEVGAAATAAGHEEPRPEQWRQSSIMGRRSDSVVPPKQPQRRQEPRQQDNRRTEVSPRPSWIDAKVESHIARPSFNVRPDLPVLRHLSGKHLDQDKATLELVVDAATWEKIERLTGGVEKMERQSGGAKIEVGQIFEKPISMDHVPQQGDEDGDREVDREASKMSSRRSLLLSGTLRQVHALEQSIHAAQLRIHDQKLSPAPTTYTATVPIPTLLLEANADLVWTSSLQDIERRTRCASIRVVPLATEIGPSEAVKIEGKEMAVKAAEREVRAMLERKLRGGRPQPGGSDLDSKDSVAPVYRTGLRIPRHPQFAQGRSFTSVIIGKRGDLIRGVQNKSGCGVSIVRHVAYLTGTEVAVRRAESALRDVVEELCETEGLQLEAGTGWEVVEPLRPVLDEEGLRSGQEERTGTDERNLAEAEIAVGVREDGEGKGEGEGEEEGKNDAEGKESAEHQPTANDAEQLAQDLKLTLRALTHPVVLITALQQPSASSPPIPPSSDFESQLSLHRGVTISSFTTVSLSPPNPYISFNLRVPSRTWDAISFGKRAFNVHILAASPQGAAIAHAFTQPYDDPGEPFVRLLRAGANILLPQHSRSAPLRVMWGSAVLARLKARVVREKCVRVGDHVVAVAMVTRVRRFSYDLVEDGSGEEVASEGLAYAMRGYRGLGVGVDALELEDSKREVAEGLGETHEVENRAESGHDGLNTAAGVETVAPSIDQDAATTLADHSDRSLEEQATDYFRGMGSVEEDESSRIQTAAVAAPAEEQEVYQDGEERADSFDLSDFEPVDYAAEEYAEAETTTSLGSTTVLEDPQEQWQDDEQALNSSRGPSARSSASRQRRDSNMGLKHWTARPKDRLESNLKIEYSTLARPKHGSRKLDSPPVTRPYSTSSPATPQAPSSLVSDPALLSSTVGEFLGLSDDNRDFIRPKRIRELYRTREEAKAASLRLEQGRADGTLTGEEAANLEKTVLNNERRVKTTLARRAADDLRRMLDRGRVTDVRRAQWMESTIEEGQAILLADARRLREALDSGVVTKEDFDLARKRLEMEGTVLSMEVMRLRQMVEEDAEGAAD